VIKFATKLHVGFLEFISGSFVSKTVVTLSLPVPFSFELGQEAQNVQLPVRLEQAVQFVGQTSVVVGFRAVQTPDELKY